MIMVATGVETCFVDAFSSVTHPWGTLAIMVHCWCPSIVRG